jgi:Domain of unknown function (DUF1963)
MADEPVDRRGLFRDLFRQATDAIVPVLGTRLDAVLPPIEPAAREVHTQRTVTLEELLAKADEFGLEGHSGALARLARVSLRMMPAAHAPAAGVEFGGRPLMNETQHWPSWQDRPLTFLAQVESGEQLGRLLFFWDTTGRPSGCLAAHRGSARVLRANDSRLFAGEGPALPPSGFGGQLAGELLIPGAASVEVQALGLDEQQREAWAGLRGELESLQGTKFTDTRSGVFQVVHRLFGYPDERGGEMPLTCELASSGEDVIEGRARLHPQASKLEQRSGRWELLAELSGDGKLGWPWVAQRIYFWVDRDALAAGDLEQVWAIAR